MVVGDRDARWEGWEGGGRADTGFESPSTQPTLTYSYAEQQHEREGLSLLAVRIISQGIGDGWTVKHTKSTRLMPVRGTANKRMCELSHEPLVRCDRMR